MTYDDLPSTLAGIRIPDTALVREILDVVAGTSPSFLLNHCLRVFVFGSLLCRRHGREYDAEIGLVAALMHDLGLTDRYATPDHRFEVDGADAARTLLAERGVDSRIGELVWDAIALHTAFGIAERKAPEIALVHYGINVDVGGVGADRLSEEDVGAVVEAFPRLGFSDEFRSLVAEHANRRPACHLFTWAGWIALEDRLAPGAPSTEILHSTRWTD